MKKLISLIALFTSLTTFASLKPCGESRIETKNLNWSKLSNLFVKTLVLDVDGVLCVGTSPSDPFAIKKLSYRDSTGTKRLFPYERLLRGAVVLIKDTDINLGAVIRKGRIMTLQMENIEKGKFKVHLNFLRNLAKFFTPKDHRRLTVKVDQDEQGNFSLYYKKKDLDFNGIEIHISAALNISKAVFLDGRRSLKSVSTKSLPKVSEILFFNENLN